MGPATHAKLLKRSLYLSDPYLGGEDVKAVQQILVSKGFSLTPDGIFGPSTEKAVQTFQRQVGTFVDGVVGPRTRQLLAARRLSLTYPNLKGPDVEAIQKALTRAGITVAIDGQFGPSTERAIKQFQFRQNLIADGVVGPQTLVRLGAL